MIDNFKKTKYYKYLFENLKEIKREGTIFSEEVLGLLNRKTDELGSVLKSHLIVEYYIDTYLKAAYPTIQNWESSRLTFSQKLELIKNDRTPIGMYYPSLKSLNSLRNKFSHNISYVIRKEDYKEIETMVSVWSNALNEPVPEGLALIEEYTVSVCRHIDGMQRGIKRHAKTLGLPAYLEWLSEMQKVEE